MNMTLALENTAGPDQLWQIGTPTAKSATATRTGEPVFVPASQVYPWTGLSVLGEGFAIELAEKGAFHLTHPTWSLMGAGDSLEDAVLDLMAEARELAELMVDVPDSALEERVRDMRDFATRFLTVSL